MQNNTHWPNTTFKCPHCHALTTFTCTYSAYGEHEGSYHPISVWACQHCDRGIFLKHPVALYEHTARHTFDTNEIFPANEPSVDKRVPEGIAADFIEAARCFNISSLKASAVMARRAIQKMCVNLGATKGEKLFKQVAELKTAGRLHPDLADIATEIRFLGNDGAHPEDDGLDEISPEDAKEVLDFTAELLDDLYVRPEKVKAMKQRREAKKVQE